MAVFLRISAFNKPSGLHTLVGVRLGCSLAPLHVACSVQRITSSGDSNTATPRVNLARQTEGDVMSRNLLSLFIPTIIAIHPSRHCTALQMRQNRVGQCPLAHLPEQTTNCEH